MKHRFYASLPALLAKRAAGFVQPSVRCAVIRLKKTVDFLPLALKTKVYTLKFNLALTPPLKV